MTIQAIVEANKELLNEREAASLLTCAPGSLGVWRSTGRYSIPFIKVGHLVRYRRKDLLAWLESRTRDSGATA
jgi:hypothetical protein